MTNYQLAVVDMLRESGFIVDSINLEADGAVTLNGGYPAFTKQTVKKVLAVTIETDISYRTTVLVEGL